MNIEKLVFKNEDIMIIKIDNNYFIDELYNDQVISSSSSLDKNEINTYLINNNHQKININDIE